MKQVMILTVLLAAALESRAQPESIYFSAQRPPVEVSIGAVYQSFEQEGLRLSELSTPVSVLVPVGRTTAVTLSAGTASVSGNEVEGLSGLGDVQAGVSHFVETSYGSLVLNLGVNLPSGKKSLSAEEFVTSVLLSRNFYDFQVPILGQGLNVAPGLTWCYQARDNLALGVGVSYQYRGDYEPVEQMADAYDPGDEVLMVGGLDLRLSRRWTVSGDVLYTVYGTDTVGDREIYSSGNRMTVVGQLLGQIGFNRWHVVLRYRRQDRSALPAGFGAERLLFRALPNVGEARGSYRWRVTSRLYTTMLVAGRLYGETDFCTEYPGICDSQAVVDLGVAPEVMLGRSVTLVTRAVYRMGSLSGYEVSAGIRVEP